MKETIACEVSIKNITFDCDGTSLSIKNLPDKKDIENLRKITHEIEKTITIFAILSMLMVFTTSLSLIVSTKAITANLSGRNANVCTGISLLMCIILFNAAAYLYSHRHTIAVKHITKKETALQYELYFKNIYEQIAKKRFEPKPNKEKFFLDELYRLTAYAENIWRLVTHIRDSRVQGSIKMELDTKRNHLDFTYEYTDDNGDIKKDYIYLLCDITKNINLKKDERTFDFHDMTFRMSNKKDTD